MWYKTQCKKHKISTLSWRGNINLLSCDSFFLKKKLHGSAKTISSDAVLSCCLSKRTTTWASTCPLRSLLEPMNFVGFHSNWFNSYENSLKFLYSKGCLHHFFCNHVFFLLNSFIYSSNKKEKKLTHRPILL